VERRSRLMPVVERRSRLMPVVERRSRLMPGLHIHPPAANRSRLMPQHRARRRRRHNHRQLQTPERKLQPFRAAGCKSSENQWRRQRLKLLSPTILSSYPPNHKVKHSSLSLLDFEYYFPAFLLPLEQVVTRLVEHLDYRFSRRRVIKYHFEDITLSHLLDGFLAVDLGMRTYIAANIQHICTLTCFFKLHCHLKLPPFC
jgi:hypothetical protein